MKIDLSGRVESRCFYSSLVAVYCAPERHLETRKGCPAPGGVREALFEELWLMAHNRAFQPWGCAEYPYSTRTGCRLCGIRCSTVPVPGKEGDIGEYIYAYICVGRHLVYFCNWRLGFDTIGGRHSTQLEVGSHYGYRFYR
jgi:hypothetical protein